MLLACLNGPISLRSPVRAILGQPPLKGQKPGPNMPHMPVRPSGATRGRPFVGSGSPHLRRIVPGPFPKSTARCVRRTRRCWERGEVMTSVRKNADGSQQTLPRKKRWIRRLLVASGPQEGCPVLHVVGGLQVEQHQPKEFRCPAPCPGSQ